MVLENMTKVVVLVMTRFQAKDHTEIKERASATQKSVQGEKVKHTKYFKLLESAGMTLRSQRKRPSSILGRSMEV